MWLEILREQPKDIPAFLAAYFKHLDLNIRAGHNHSSLITERIVELKIIKNASTQETVEKPETIETGTSCYEATKDKPYNADDECSIPEIERDDVIVTQSDSNNMSLEQAESSKRKFDTAIQDQEENENEEPEISDEQITEEQKNAMAILNYHESDLNFETTNLPESNLVLVSADTIVQDSIMVLVKESEQVINEMLENPTEDVRAAFSDIEHAIKLEDANNEEKCCEKEEQECCEDENVECCEDKVENCCENEAKECCENEQTENGNQIEANADGNVDENEQNNIENEEKSESNLEESSENVQSNIDLNDGPTNKMDIIENPGDVNEGEQIC